MQAWSGRKQLGIARHGSDIELVQLLHLHVNLLLLPLRLVHACLDQLDEVNFGSLRLVKVVLEEVGHKRLHDALVLHQIRAKHLFHFAQPQVEPPSDKLEEDEGQDEGEEEDDDAAEQLDSHEAEVACRKETLLVVRQTEGNDSPQAAE